MKKYLPMLRRLFWAACKLVPFWIGLYCYYPAFTVQEGHIYPFLDALYAAIKLYSGSTDGSVPVGGLLQLARFWALFVSLSLLVRVFNKMHDLVNWGKLLNPNATVVYGDSCYADYTFESLEPRSRIRGEGRWIAGAARYLLMFSSDAENLAFYSRHCEELRGKRVYIMLDGIARQSIEDPMVTVFSLAENCARQYWKDYPVLKSEKIAILGFDELGQNLLLYGLQMNLINPAQHFEYHIYGSAAEFCREHTELDKMDPDEIFFHKSGEYQYAQMAAFDRIILCGGDKGGGAAEISRLLAAAPLHCPIHVYAPSRDIMTSLFGGERLVCFGSAKQAARAETIFNEEALQAARRQHAFYVSQYGGVPWEKLDAFKRYSNVSSCDYLPTLTRLLQEGMPVEQAAELEHIRWNRYHYLHNWKYGPETDSARRIHKCLVPFADLSEEEKRKDIEAIQSKL